MTTMTTTTLGVTGGVDTHETHDKLLRWLADDGREKLQINQGQR